MISEADKNAIIRTAKKYGVKKVLLFGSSLTADPAKARDIDLAVQGVAPSCFFKFYGDLIFSLSKPVDIIDLDNATPFSEMIAEEGTVVYG